MSGRASKKAGMLASSRSRHRPSGTPPQSKRVVPQEPLAEDSTEGSTPGTPNGELAASAGQTSSSAARGTKSTGATSGTADHATSTPPAKEVLVQLPRESMQLSYKAKDGDEGERLPRYPVADTIALLLILVNFPNALAAVSHILFAYKEHVLPSATSGGAPPLAMVLFVDAVVLLLTAVLLPMLRHIVTDTAHVIIAISLSGAHWKLSLPFALGLTALRSTFSRLWLMILDDDNFAVGGSGSGSDGSGELADKYGHLVRQVLRPLGAMRFRPTVNNAIATTQALEQVTSAIAIHVFTLGLVRLAHHWLRSSDKARKLEGSSAAEKGQSQSANAISGKAKKKQPNSVVLGSQHSTSASTASSAAAHIIDPRDSSIWDTVLQWRLEFIDKRHDFGALASSDGLASGAGNGGDLQMWVSEIASTYIVVGFSVPEASLPSVELHVNGLLWRSKQSIGSARGDRFVCSLFIDNLSPKTEYDLALHIAPDAATEQQVSVCTQPHPQQPVTRRRGDSSALPPIHTGQANNATTTSTAAPTTTASPFSANAGTTTTAVDEAQANTSAPSLATATATASATAPSHPNGPPSPISTLEDAIANAGAKAEERRAGVKRVRRENAKRLQALSKELEHLSTRANAVDKTEHRLQGRILSLQNELRRMDVQLEEADSERDALRSQRDAHKDRWAADKARADAVKQREASLRQALEESRRAREHRQSGAEAEAARTRAKADKLSAKRTRIQQELDRLGAQADDVLRKEYAQRVHDRERTMDRRLQIEADLLKSIHEMTQAIELGLTYG